MDAAVCTLARHAAAAFASANHCCSTSTPTVTPAPIKTPAHSEPQACARLATGVSVLPALRIAIRDPTSPTASSTNATCCTPCIECSEKKSRIGCIQTPHRLRAIAQRPHRPLQRMKALPPVTETLPAGRMVYTGSRTYSRPSLIPDRCLGRATSAGVGQPRFLEPRKAAVSHACAGHQQLRVPAFALVPSPI
jgi:hypothetical protein